MITKEQAIKALSRGKTVRLRSAEGPAQVSANSRMEVTRKIDRSGGETLGPVEILNRFLDGGATIVDIS